MRVIKGDTRSLDYSANGDHLCLRVPVRNNHLLAHNMYQNYYHPQPKYLIIGYLDPLGLYIFATERENFKILQSGGSQDGRKLSGLTDPSCRFKHWGLFPVPHPELGGSLARLLRL